MANGTDSEEFVLLSRVRAGLKREFAFALKVQSEISGSLGRTRSRKVQNGVAGDGVAENPSSNKRLKSCGLKESEKDIEKDGKTSDFEKSVRIDGDSMEILSEEEAKSDVVDLDEPKSDFVELGSERGLGEGTATRICEEEFKSDVAVEAVSDNEKKSRLLELENDLMQPICEDEPGKNQEKTENDPGKELVDDPHTVREEKEGEENSGRKRDLEELPIDGRENDTMKNDGNPPPEEGPNGSAPVLISDDSMVEKVLKGYTFKRFTRSALKPKVYPVKKSAEKDDFEETDARATANGDNGKVEGTDGTLVTPLKTSKKVVRKFPSKLKDLLDSGILEGLNVNYIRGTKVKESGATGLRGIVNGSGILCFCHACEGIKVVTPTVYELHAGSSNKRPPEYIYLENGNTLRDVMNAFKDAPLATLEEAIQKVIGCSSMNRPIFCLNCRGSITEAGTGKSVLLCHSCTELRVSQVSSAELADNSDGSPKSNLAPKSSYCISKCSSSRTNSQGRITRKDLRLHKLVFEEDVLPDGTEVGYYVRGQKLLVGYKRGFGIFCSCCNSEVSPSQFEAHAGWASRRKPFQHIYTSNGVSLHELSISLSKLRKSSTVDSDDLCRICADGGDLVCCDMCPRAFHIECISLPSIPTGTWYCKYCQNTLTKEKFVERNANAVAAGRVAGVDPIEQITKRCIRIVKPPEAEVGGCVLCRGHGFSKSGFGPRTVIICDQCEKEFHVGCLKDHNMDDLKELPKGKWFCCRDCNGIHSALLKLVVRGEEKLPDSFLNVIKNKHEGNGSDSGANLDIRWRVISGKIASDDDRVLLSSAIDIFHDRFDPIIDSASTRNLIPYMVYGKTVRDRDFSGMYCAILTVNQAVVSVGLFRIFGKEMAELPLVATSVEFQGQGYFQCLFSCIEKLLGFLNVKDLVLPAANEAESIWINKFGFKKISQDELIKYRKDNQMMTFQGTSMLEKSVPKCRIVVKSEDS